jgi:y4mF family transcriptional regulator
MRIGSTRDLGLYVRESRRAAGLNQTDLAGRAAVSRRWLSDLEMGKPTIEAGLIFQVLAALGLYLDALPEPAADIDLDSYLATFDGAP